MGTGDSGTPTKTPKGSTVQDQPPAPTSYAEWAAAFQAYYGATPPPGYYPPAISPGQPHPYIWTGQPVIPPYGAGPPFAAMYPTGHPYAHPSIPQVPHPYPFGVPSTGGVSEGALATTTTDQGESKSSDGKDRSPLKRSKRCSGSPKRSASKARDCNKSTPISANGGLSQSADSGSEGSSAGSDQENTQDMLDKSGVELPLEGGCVGNVFGQTSSTFMAQSIVPSSTVPGRPSGLAPATNLNAGLEYWSVAHPGTAMMGKGKRNTVATQALVSSHSANPVLGVGGREGATSDFWLQDERELKRQRRKQSNRESARRSRLRKQAECEELATRVDTLTVENMALRTEINRLVEERDKLSTDNNALLDRLKKYRDDSSSGVKLSDLKEDYLATSLLDNGKVRDAFDAEAFRVQGLRGSREESGKAVEHLSSGLDMGGRAAAVSAS